MPTLILTPRHTDDAQALWRAAGRLGWRIERYRVGAFPIICATCRNRSCIWKG